MVSEMTTPQASSLSPKSIRKAENTDLPLLGLRTIRELREALDELELAQIDSARDKGASWEDIAEAMGVTRQALQQRLKHRDEKRGPNGVTIRI